MAFTDSQKMDIRKYLGVPFGFYTLTSRLESMMDLVGQNATAQTEIETWLTRLSAIDTALTSSSSSTVSYGPLKAVDEVEFFEPKDDSEGGASISLIDQGRTLIDRMARAFGVSDILPHGDYFGTTGPAGISLPLG